MAKKIEVKKRLNEEWLLDELYPQTLDSQRIAVILRQKIIPLTSLSDRMDENIQQTKEGATNNLYIEPNLETDVERIKREIEEREAAKGPKDPVQESMERARARVESISTEAPRMQLSTEASSIKFIKVIEEVSKGGSSDLEIINKLGINPVEYNAMKQKWMEGEEYMLKLKGSVDWMSEYMYRQRMCVQKINEIVDKAFSFMDNEDFMKTSKAVDVGRILSSVSSALKVKSDIIDKMYDKAEDMGFVERKPITVNFNHRIVDEKRPVIDIIEEEIESEREKFGNIMGVKH